METIQETLRATAPQKPPGGLNKRRVNPTRLFVDRDRLAWWWFLCAGAVLIGAAVDRYYLVTAFRQQEHVVIIDPADTYYVSPLLKFEQATELHAQQSTLATIALLQRNPEDFDQPELLKQMFLKSAHDKALALRSFENAEFKAKQIHQKPEIARIDMLEIRADAVLTQVNGQLIRSGIFQEKAFTEAVPFTLKLKLQRNPNMVENGRFPTAVRDFKYETTR